MIHTIAALSVRQPAVFAIGQFGQRIVNCPTWRAPMPALAAAHRLVGAPILLHAGQDCGSADSFCREVDAIIRITNRADTATLRALTTPTSRGFKPADSLPRRALVARATLADVVRTTEGGHRHHLGPAQDCLLCGLHRPGDAERCPSADSWARPGVGLVLANVVLLPVPIPYAGAGGWFKVPTLVLDHALSTAEGTSL